MKTEEAKFVYQQQTGPLLVPKTKNVDGVYQDTTVGRREKKICCGISGHLFSRLRLILSCLAIISCLIVIGVLMTNGIKASNSREQAQEEEIAMLKELVENQQSRLHRMQKELQFLVTRQKAYEAREDSFRRRQLPIVPSTHGTGTGSHVWPSPAEKSFHPENEDGQDKIPLVDSELPPIPRREETMTTSILDDEVDVDKLPRASANKKRKGKMPLDDDQQL